MEAVSEESLRTVVFLCVDQSDSVGTRRLPKATGLLVTVPVENSPNHTVHYIVTARHCIDEARQFKCLYVRMNRKTGKFAEFPTNIEDWYTHDRADVAAIPITSIPPSSDVKPEDLDLASILISSFVSGAPNYECVLSGQYRHKVIQPRVGHQVYLLGLFTEHHGEGRNLPIARFGHISRMPDKLNVKINETDVSIIAYLIEFHSIGGHSGSPVFFMYPMVVEDYRTLQLEDGKLNIPIATNFVWHTGFMGLVSGHYPVPEKAKRTGEFTRIEGDIRTNLNSGIAFVTPAEAVTQLLMREDLMEHRKEFKKMAESQRPTPTFNFTNTKDSFTQHDFEEALKKVSRRIKPDKSV